jgi:rhamnogalacturonan endolyase
MSRKAIAAVLAIALLAIRFPAHAAANADPPVVLYESTDKYLLENGYVAVMVSKSSGEILSLKFNDRELLADPGAKSPGIWFNPLPANGATARMTVNPFANHGVRGEISIAAAQPLGIDIRYSLVCGDHALYAWQILRHPENFPAARVSSGGFQLRLNPALFDYLTAGKSRAHAIPSATDWVAATPYLSPEARRITSGKLAGTIYCAWDDAATQMETPVYGFSGTKSGAGLWIINPSPDYLSLGGNIVAPTGWLDPIDGAPTLLNRWGGEPGANAGISVDRGQAWSHVIGPFLLYCNQGSFADAQARAKLESRQWPYVWAAENAPSPAPPLAALTGRAVLGQAALATSAFPTSPPISGSPSSFRANQNGSIVQSQYGSFQQNRFGTLTPGAQGTAPTDVPATQPVAQTRLQGAMLGLSSDSDWQTNFFDNQFWTRAGDDGTFSFSNVPPGDYVLHIYSDGEIGEGVLSGIHLESGKTLDKGNINWTPVHYGQFVWQLGYPNRSAGKFRHGDDATHWGQWALNQSEFPRGVSYYIGKSDPHVDWNYVQIRGSTWAIHFQLGFVPDQGAGFLDVAFAGGSDGANLRPSINGHNISSHHFMPNPPISRPAGAVAIDDIARDQVHGFCLQNIYAFDPSYLGLGDNVLLLRVDGTKATDGLMYDSIRLEIRPDSAYLTGQDPNDGQGLPVVSPATGFDFGQSYYGDPSGNYTGLTPRSGKRSR